MVTTGVSPRILIPNCLTVICIQIRHLVGQRLQEANTHAFSVLHVPENAIETSYHVNDNKACGKPRDSTSYHCYIRSKFPDRLEQVQQYIAMSSRRGGRVSTLRLTAHPSRLPTVKRRGFSGTSLCSARSRLSSRTPARVWSRSSRARSSCRRCCSTPARPAPTGIIDVRAESCHRRWIVSAGRRERAHRVQTDIGEPGGEWNECSVGVGD